MMRIDKATYLIVPGDMCQPHIPKETNPAKIIAIPPMEGVNLLWIFLPPGISPMFALLRIIINTGKIKTPRPKEEINDKS